MSGFFIIVFAAFIWGIGNAVTGYTAHQYAATGSLFPAVDIALANTLGGLFFLIPARYIGVAVAARQSGKAPYAGAQHNAWRTLFAGLLKGSNTCFFVFSTTYIAATQSLVLESTYIVWSLAFAIFFSATKPASLIAKGSLIFVAALLVSGQTDLQLNTKYHVVGSVFGVAAGVTYALFLFFWSGVTARLNRLTAQIASTGTLQTISLLSILVLGEVFSLIFLGTIWKPLGNLRNQDILLQMVNGVFVIGVTYLLLTMGMARLRESQQGAGLLAALGLSFSIPLTLLPEVLASKFRPNVVQVSGILLFMFLFVTLSADSKKTSVPKN